MRPRGHAGRLAARAAALAACAAVAGCTVVGGGSTWPEGFAPQDYAWSRQSGPNTLEVRALSDATTQAPGPCVGYATLIPNGPYLGSHLAQRGNRYIAADAQVDQADVLNFQMPLRTGYLARRAHCDAKGRFAFHDLPDGDYLLFVPLKGGGRRQIRKRVRLSGWRTLNLTLTHTCVHFPISKEEGSVFVCGPAPFQPIIPSEMLRSPATH